MSEKILAEPLWEPIVDLCMAFKEKTGADVQILMKIPFVQDPPVPDGHGNLCRTQHAGPQMRIEITVTDLAKSRELRDAFYEETDHRHRTTALVPAASLLYRFEDARRRGAFDEDDESSRSGQSGSVAP